MIPPYLITVSDNSRDTILENLRSRINESLANVSLSPTSSVVLTVILCNENADQEQLIDLYESTRRIIFSPNGERRSGGPSIVSNISRSGNSLREFLLASLDFPQHVENIPYADTLIAYLIGKVDESSSHSE